MESEQETSERVESGYETSERVESGHETSERVESGQETSERVESGHETSDRVELGQETSEGGVCSILLCNTHGCHVIESRVVKWSIGTEYFSGDEGGIESWKTTELRTPLTPKRNG